MKFVEGEYNLNVMKEVKVTDSFLGLDQVVRGCQNQESLHDCSTRNHIDTYLDKCGCRPFNMKFSHKVNRLKTVLVKLRGSFWILKFHGWNIEGHDRSSVVNLLESAELGGYSRNFLHSFRRKKSDLNTDR